MWRVVKDAMVDVKVRSLSSAKSFAVMGGVYATVECFLENYRGKKGTSRPAEGLHKNMAGERGVWVE